MVAERQAEASQDGGERRCGMNAYKLDLQHLSETVRMISIAYAVNKGELDKALLAATTEADVEAAAREFEEYTDPIIEGLEAFCLLAHRQQAKAEQTIKLIRSLRGGFDVPEPYDFVFGCQCEIDAILLTPSKLETPEQPTAETADGWIQWEPGDLLGSRTTYASRADNPEHFGIRRTSKDGGKRYVYEVHTHYLDEYVKPGALKRKGMSK
jgi:hypothetical protein